MSKRKKTKEKRQKKNQGQFVSEINELDEIDTCAGAKSRKPFRQRSLNSPNRKDPVRFDGASRRTKH